MIVNSGVRYVAPAAPAAGETMLFEDGEVMLFEDGVEMAFE